MIYRILTAIAILLLSGCNGEMEFKRVESSFRYGKLGYDEVFLVANTPNNKALRDSLLLEFAKKTIPDFCTVSADINSYSIFFFKSTQCTRSFDARNMGDAWSLSSDDEGCPEDKFSVFFWYRRSETNPKNWYLYLPRTDADTIYCQ